MPHIFSKDCQHGDNLKNRTFVKKCGKVTANLQLYKMCRPFQIRKGCQGKSVWQFILQKQGEKKSEPNLLNHGDLCKLSEKKKIEES